MQSSNCARRSASTSHINVFSSVCWGGYRLVARALRCALPGFHFPHACSGFDVRFGRVKRGFWCSVRHCCPDRPCHTVLACMILYASCCRSYAPANMFRWLGFEGDGTSHVCWCLVVCAGGCVSKHPHETCRQFGTMFRTCCARSSSSSASGACTCERVSFHPSHDAADVACSKALSKLSKKMEVPSFSSVNSSLSQARQHKMP